MIGEKVLKKLRLKSALETAYIWSVKYTNFKKFFKKHTSIAEFMPLHFYATSSSFIRVSLSFCAALLLQEDIFRISAFPDLVCKLCSY